MFDISPEWFRADFILRVEQESRAPALRSCSSQLAAERSSSNMK